LFHGPDPLPNHYAGGKGLVHNFTHSSYLHTAYLCKRKNGAIARAIRLFLLGGGIRGGWSFKAPVRFEKKGRFGFCTFSNKTTLLCPARVTLLG